MRLIFRARTTVRMIYSRLLSAPHIVVIILSPFSLPGGSPSSSSSSSSSRDGGSSSSPGEDEGEYDMILDETPGGEWRGKRRMPHVCRSGGVGFMRCE